MFEIIDLQNEIFRPVSLSLKKGQSLIIKGASGSGKTRFLRALADLDPSKGNVLLDGVERSMMPAFEWRKKVRFVPASSHWWHERVGLHFDRNKTDLLKWMEALDLPEKLLQWPVEDLSTGEKQRLSFLRAIQDQPKVLLLDEPTSALDGQSIARMELMIESELNRGAIILLVSHSPKQIEKYGAISLTFKSGKARLTSDEKEIS